ncbi:glycosyltransferase [Candidatus Symbiobacter mobilis CR]|uniref:Glycosyltransferase n=2 Tax=Candidatus Symbiobacter TaxID=1436289 RepID=U5NA04_9BURK|nr:glycosyltransferase [Candidatus Symbiobacter mobilis CR]
MDDNIAVKKTLNNSLACIFLNISKYNNINPISTLGACLPIIINTEHNYDKLLDDASWYISIDQLCELESIIKLLYKNRFDKIAFRTNAIMKSLCYGWDRCIEQAVSVYKLSHVFWGAGIQSSSQDTIANLDNKKVRLAELPNPANPILVDAVFFQLYKTGIARVWQSLLREWAGTEFGKRLIVLDRGSTAPRIEGLTYFDIPKYDYEDTDDDRAMLQRVCDKFGAKLLISSYYTTPITTPSVFLAHDMIPELSGVDVLNHPMWREKHRGIRHACHFLAVSQNTANDLRRFFPQIKPEQVTVTPNGVDFRPANPQAVAAFRQQHGISRPYFLLVGARDGYKNTILFFRAFASMGAARRRFAIVCTGPVATLESEYAAYIGEAAVHMLQLDDDGLQCAYSGALALVYPSLYEGFGMPIVEAMACGCPVITTRKGSIPEVAGDAVLYVDPEDTASMKRVLKLVEKPPTRKQYVDLGLQRAARYSWGKMAEEVRAVLERFAPLEGTVEVPPSIHDQQLSQTFALHQAGKLEQAETLYRSLHQWMPLDFRVLHMLGVLRFQRGDLSDAQYFLLYALALNQNVAEAHFNLGNVYAAMQLWELAHNAYQRALVVNPGFGPARQQLAVMEHNLRAVAAQQAEQGQEVEGQP